MNLKFWKCHDLDDIEKEMALEFYNKFKNDDIPKMKNTVIGRHKIIKKQKKEINQLKEELKIHGLRQIDEYVKLKEKLQETRAEVLSQVDIIMEHKRKYKELKEIVEKIKKESKHHAYQYCTCTAHEAIQKLLADTTGNP